MYNKVLNIKSVVMCCSLGTAGVKQFSMKSHLYFILSVSFGLLCFALINSGLCN